MSTIPTSRTRRLEREEKKTGKRIPVELTRGDVFEISAYFLHISRSAEEASVDLPERSRGGRGSWARGNWMSRCQSLTLCQKGWSVWRFLKHSHISPRSGAACVFEPEVLTKRICSILDTSTGYGTACVIDVKGGGDKYVISSAVSFLKELGYTRFRCRTDPEPAIKAMVGAVIKGLSDVRAVEQVLPEETIPEGHASLGGLEGWHNLLQGQIRALRLDVDFDFGQSSVLLISACRGL